MPTPEDFAHEIEAKTVEALPIVENPHAIWEAGFCTYANTFDQYPEVEIICGGFNHKTPTAAAIWRQGNLLHFGFKQSPAEMNDFGDHMLLNSVAYISHFSQDRPIAIAPGAFVGNYVRPRSVVGRWWVKPDYKEGVKSVVSEVVWDQIHQQDNAEAMFKWIEEHTPYFYPAEDGRLAVDPDLKALTMGFDDAKFLPTVIADLDHSDTAAQESAKRLLKRYAPDGPVDSSKADWLAWYEENRPYLFATDQGDYRWYIDPLAKARGVPSKDLRSAARMDK